MVKISKRSKGRRSKKSKQKKQSIKYNSKKRGKSRSKQSKHSYKSIFNQNQNHNNIHKDSLQHCAPKVNINEPNRKSCFDNDVLLKLIKAWNKTYKDNKIQKNHTKINLILNYGIF